MKEMDIIKIVNNRVRWLELIRKRWKPVSDDKRENALKFATIFLCMPEDMAKELVYRPIKWNIIKAYSGRGKKVNCPICGKEGMGGYWCSPCINDWCCECCILLAYPGYIGGTPIPDVKDVEKNLEKEG